MSESLPLHIDEVLEEQDGEVGLVLGGHIQEGRPPAAILLLPQLHPRKTSCLPGVIF